MTFIAVKKLCIEILGISACANNIVKISGGGFLKKRKAFRKYEGNRCSLQ